MCGRCEQILRLIVDTKLQAKTEHRDFHRAGARAKSIKAEGGYQYLRKLEKQVRVICEIEAVK